jgi:hypothetical protein
MPTQRRQTLGTQAHPQAREAGSRPLQKRAYGTGEVVFDTRGDVAAFICSATKT